MPGHPASTASLAIVPSTVRRGILTVVRGSNDRTATWIPGETWW